MEFVAIIIFRSLANLYSIVLKEQYYMTFSFSHPLGSLWDI